MKTIIRRVRIVAKMIPVNYHSTATAQQTGVAHDDQTDTTYYIRPAAADDMITIRALIREGGINPFGLKWPNFRVATSADGTVIGCGQIKPHRDCFELASIAVTPTWQKRGIARAVIAELMIHHTVRPLWLQCASRMVPYYEGLAFVEIHNYAELPRYFRRTKRIGDIISRLITPGQYLAVMRTPDQG